MRSIITRVVTLSALAVTAAPLALHAQEGQRFSLGGRDVAIYNLVGSIKAVRGSGSDVVVTVAKSGKDAGEPRVAQGPLEGRQTLRLIYPASRATSACSTSTPAQAA